MPNNPWIQGAVLGRRPDVSTTMPVKDPNVPEPADPNIVPPQPKFDKAPEPFMGFTPKHAMEGFDFARLQNPGKSAKDAFAWLANQAPPPPIGDKNALNVWFSTYIQPGMRQLGHNVTDVQGDKFRYNNWEGDFWVDYGRGAGAPGGALAWQADYAQGGPAAQSYNQTQKSILQPVSENINLPSQNVTGVPSQYSDMGQYYQYLQSLMSK